MKERIMEVLFTIAFGLVIIGGLSLVDQRLSSLNNNDIVVTVNK